MSNPQWEYRRATPAQWKLIDQVLAAESRNWFALQQAFDALDDVTPMVERALNHVCSLSASIQEALNSGDGTYRP